MSRQFLVFGVVQKVLGWIIPIGVLGLVAVFGALATAGTTGIAIVYGIDPILDMIRTATNVGGQITVPVLVARSENLLDEEVLRAPSTPPLLEQSAG
jgi:Na+/H+-dicarboxylate symporter